MGPAVAVDDLGVIVDLAGKWRTRSSNTEHLGSDLIGIGHLAEHASGADGPNSGWITRPMLDGREPLSEVTMATIVVGFKNNDGGQRALDLAIKEARRRSAKLFVVNSLRGGYDTSPEEINESRSALESVKERLPEEGIEFDVQQYVRDNSASEDILAVATENNAELVVVGYHRRSATGKLLLGSTPLNVMQGAECPVLAIAES